MPNKPLVVPYTPEQLARLKALTVSRTVEIRLVERARMVLRCLDDAAIKTIAAELGVKSNTVITWRDRFIAQGLEGLHDRVRSGKPPTYTPAFRDRVLATLETDPPLGQATWDGPTLAAYLGASDDMVCACCGKKGSACNASGVGA